MSIESEAQAEAEKRYPAHLPYNKAFEGAMRDREAFEQGYLAGASRPVTDEQVEAAMDVLVESDDMPAGFEPQRVWHALREAIEAARRS